MPRRKPRLTDSVDDMLTAARFLIDPDFTISESEAARIALVLAQMGGVLLAMDETVNG